MTTLNVGDKAPDFALARDGGGTLSLHDLQGIAFVLYFYPKDDTAGCTQEAIDFSAMKPDFEKLGVRMIGISPDSVKRHDKFKSKHDLSIELLSDEEKSVLQAYGVWKEKSMYGRKYMGVERTTFLIGHDGKIADIWTKVRVANHAAEVLAAAKQL
ncbi:MAG: thioredoxin-dependent thiol peroxidase [Phyllobacterium sp.]